MKSKKNVNPILLILLQNILYGFGDPISKYAYTSVPVYSLLAIRYCIAFLFLVPICGKKTLNELRNNSIRSLILPSFCISTAFIICNYAMKFSNATSVAFLRSTSIVITPLLALIIYKKPYSLKHIPILIFIVLGL